MHESGSIRDRRGPDSGFLFLWLRRFRVVSAESGSSRPRVKSARVNSAGSTRPVWGPRNGGRVVRLESGCICMSIC